MLAGAFIPAVAPRIAISRDGVYAVIVDSARAVVIRIADLEAVCELPIAGATDVAWNGPMTERSGSRLLVVAATETHTDVRLIDPFAELRRVAEIRVESAMRLVAANGTHALLLGTRTAAVLSAGDTAVTPYQFLTRTLPQVVGVAGTQFVVALPGTIEEWDPASRMPKRRLRLPRVATITSLGGSERVLWMTTSQEPARLDVLPLVNRGQPKAHELPEPIAAVSGHPQTDAVICIGAETGRIYAIDLDGKSRLRTIALPGIDRVEAAALIVAGNALSVIGAQAGRPCATATIDGARESEPAPPALPPIKAARPITIEHSHAPRAQAPRASVPEPGPMSSLYEPEKPVYEPEPPRPRTVAEALGGSTIPSPAAVEQELRQVAPTAWSDGTSDLMAKLAAMRAVRESSPDAPQRASWRDDAGAWARAVATGTFDRAAPGCPPIEALATRHALPAQLLPALVLLYGSHLAGLEGAAPMDVARVLGRRWDEALGRGKLAELGLVVLERSRVKLSATVLDELDAA